MVKNIKMDQLTLSAKTYNGLKSARINTVEDLVALLDKGGIPALMRVRNIGHKSVAEILKAIRKAGYNSEKYLDIYIHTLQKNPETSAASLIKWKEIRTEVVGMPYEIQTYSSYLADDLLLNKEVRYNSSSVVCPVCKKVLPSGNRFVYIPGEGTLNIRVGLCASCKSFYSFSSKLIGKEGLCENASVRWTELRYRSRNGQNLQLKKSVISNRTVIQNMSDTDAGKQIPEVRKKEVSSEQIIYDIFLSQLPVNKFSPGSCPICKRRVDKSVPVKFRIYKEGEAESRFDIAAKCERCNIVFIDEGQEKIIRSQNPGYQILTIDAAKFKNGSSLMLSATSQTEENGMADSLKNMLPFNDEKPKKINLSETREIVHIYEKKCHCVSCEKKFGRGTIRNRTVVLYTVTGSTVESNVMYCAGCGQYFMNYISFVQLQKDYGGILMERRYIGELRNRFDSNMNFSPDSILSRCGYSVQEGISSEYRQSILRYILETGKASKYELVELITGFIILGESRNLMYGACNRWREDLSFINHYNIEEQKKLYNPIFLKGK